MPADMVSHIFQVLSIAEHVQVARREARKVLERWGLDDELVATACLIVSELVTNVVRHAALLAPTAKVELSIDGAELTVSVADAHPFRPKALSAPHGAGGWGLALVKSIVEEACGSHDVVGDESTGGKAVIVRLPLVSIAGQASLLVEYPAGQAGVTRVLRGNRDDAQHSVPADRAALAETRGRWSPLSAHGHTQMLHLTIESADPDVRADRITAAASATCPRSPK